VNLGPWWEGCKGEGVKHLRGEDCREKVGLGSIGLIRPKMIEGQY